MPARLIMRCCAGGMQIKSTAYAAGIIDDLRKKGITRNAVGWCPQDSGIDIGKAGSSLFRDDENNPVSSEGLKGLYKTMR